MKTKIICVCKQAIVDKTTGRLSIINVIDTITPPLLPIVIPEIYIVLVSERQKGDPEQIDLELFVTLNRKLLGKRNISIDYLDKNFNNCIFSIHGLVIDEHGKLLFVVKRDNKQVAKCDCLLDIITKAKPEIEKRK